MNPTPELLKRCCEDDRRAHSELYRLCFGFIFTVCRRYYINRDDIESALNGVFFKMIKGMRGYVEKDRTVPFELWVRRIAINHVTDEFRKNRRYKESIDLSQPVEEISESFEHSVAYNNDKIQSAIGQLSPMSRTVFNLYVVEGYKHEEIADMLEISPNTSKVHLHRAKKQLRDLLGGMNQVVMQ
jgi:RNA polymerase sigma-70 factor (ECF subfamily)